MATSRQFQQSPANKPRTYITTNLSQPPLARQPVRTPHPIPNPDAPINQNLDENGRPAWWSRMKFDTPRPRVQPKLTVGGRNDQYEQEADKVAAEVVNQISAPQQPSMQREGMPEEEDALQMKPLAGQLTPLVQREETAAEEEDLQMMPVQREAETEGMDASPDVEAGIEQARGSGQPLDKTIREPMEQAFGADFSSVKVHTDTRADQLNHAVQAKAFTTKQDVFFRQGEYNPGSRGGQELIAHELTHVVQQSGKAVTHGQRNVENQQNSLETETRPIVQRVDVNGYQGQGGAVGAATQMVNLIRQKPWDIDMGSGYDHILAEGHNAPAANRIQGKSTFVERQEHDILIDVVHVLETTTPVFRNSILEFNTTDGRFASMSFMDGNGNLATNLRVTLNVAALPNNPAAWRIDHIGHIILTNAFPIP